MKMKLENEEKLLKWIYRAEFAIVTVFIGINSNTIAQFIELKFDRILPSRWEHFLLCVFIFIVLESVLLLMIGLFVFIQHRIKKRNK